MVNQEQINDLFREAVRYLKRQGYSQKDIVFKAKLGQNTISRIMKGENNAGDDVIQKVAEAYRLNIDFFYGKSKNISLLDEKREILDNDLFEAQRLLNMAPEHSIDNSSAINAALSAQMETIAHLKQTIEDMKEQHQRELAAKDEIIAKSDKLAEERLHRIAELRRIIDANQYGLEHLPFPPGVADKPNKKTHVNK